uniref:Cytochrome b5 heme-binding domain-containing protein n=1 Tax=Strigamia maritima TaxID=126957 RepID=T1JID8_STRMM
MLGKVVLVVLTAVIFHKYQPNAVNELWSRISVFFNKDEPVEKFELPKGEKLFTPAELSKYNGEEEGPYLGIFGRVYDVSAGAQHYGPGGAYNQFSGRDATRSFVTGDFSPEGLTDDITDFTPQQMLSLYNWLNFYETDYKYLGRIIGRYYDDTGRPTDALEKLAALLESALEKAKEENEERKKFPGCNSEWSEPTGGKVWCSTKSGGIERDWPGVPRQLFNPSTGDTRCVCVHPSHLDNPNLREYSGCESTSVSCAIAE